MKLITYNSRRARAGFSLVEILVVLVIASILAAVTLGGYSAMRASNRRTSCQANMAQIYQAIRLYSADYDGQVPYYDPNNTLGNGNGLGLWALYTFASSSNATLPADADIKPEKRYLTNAKLFHCPSDIGDNGGFSDEQMFTDNANSVYNPNYLSYQTSDTGCADPSDNSCSSSDGNYGTAQFTYNPVRSVPSESALNSDWQRQLLHYYKDTSNNLVSVGRPPTDDTVILWCPFHRGHGSSSEDNVLFWDGTVQSLPENQDGKTGAARTPITQ